MRIDKSWGWETVHHNGGYCMKSLVYTRAIASSYHYHPKKHESFFVHSGVFEIEIDGSHPSRMIPGDVLVLPPGTRHRVRCLEPGTIVEASTFDDPSDCVRLVASET